MIKIEHLTKCYGDFMAVNDLSFEIEKGHVYGFLGPNGAGKSTTMNIITGCLSPTAGKITIDGHDIAEEPEKARSLIGYLPEQPPLYMSETPYEYLKFVGEAKGVKGAELKRQINEVMEQTGITKVSNRLISHLSKGYKQRVGIAQALLGNPEVIILDEPTVGLDPLQIIEIRDLIRGLGESHTVILSSHILSEVQSVCDQVVIISQGKLVAYDTPENLETTLTENNGIYISAVAAKDAAEKALSAIEGIEKYEVTEKSDENTVDIHIQTKTDNMRSLCCDIFYAFSENKLPIFEMTSKKANLEDVFIELTETSAVKAGEVPAEENVAEDAAETAVDQENQEVEK